MHVMQQSFCEVFFWCQPVMLLLAVVMLSVCVMVVELHNCLSDMYGMG